MLRTSLTILTLASLMTACDYAERNDSRRERDSKDYHDAMADYTAGRMDAAITGFEKAIFNDPANANARFQLALLLQEYKKDYLGAYVGYREYLLQHPKSDKSPLAQDRMLFCEREMAKVLAVRYNLQGNEATLKELAAVRQELKAAQARNATLDKEIEATRARINALGAERDRLVTIVKTEDAENRSVVLRPAAKELKDLLEEDEMQTNGYVVAEIVKLRDEEAEELSSGSSLLPAARVEDDARREGRRQGERLAREEKERNRVVHPDTYVVQEGDTLYKIAERFYGRASAWRTIRDANKTLISTDGRVRVGDKLRLPNR